MVLIPLMLHILQAAYQSCLSLLAEIYVLKGYLQDLGLNIPKEQLPAQVECGYVLTSVCISSSW